MNVLKSSMQNLNRVALAFAVCLLTLTSAFALTNENHELALNNKVKSSFKPSAVFKKLWVDYDVTEGEQNGMRIHVKFSAYGMKSLDSYLAIYFLDSGGDKLKDNNDKFNSKSGDVAVYRSMKPGYDPTDYEDLSVFMPYDELDLNSGEWDLRLDVDLIYKAGGLIEHLTYEDFTYNRPEAEDTDTTPTKRAEDEDTDTTSTNGIGATIKKVWVDYNVTEGGRKGMRLHVNFAVSGLKGVDAMLTARVQNENSDYLTSNSASFSNNERELEISFSMKPGYPTTEYDDATMFLPYSEILVRKGVSTLKFDIDLNYENGKLIDHLKFQEFEFTR